MPENFGGLDYAINVVGDWEARLADFNAQVDAIDKKSKAAAARVGSATGKGQDAVTKKQIALENQLKVLRSQEVILLQSQVNLAKQVNTELTKSSTTEGKRLTQKAQQAAFEKERLTTAQRINKEQTKAADAERKAASDRTKADMLATEKQRLRAVKERAAAEKLTSAELAKQAKEQARIANEVQKSKSGFSKQRTTELEKAHTQALAINKAKAKARLYDDANYQATQRINSATRELAIKHAQINQLMASRTMTWAAAARQVGLTADEAKRLGKSLVDAQHVARQFLFTFRRLVGILAVFTFARKLAQALAGAVREMSRFNGELEIAQVGIAGIISSVGKVVDSQGNLVDGADAFGAAMEASRQVMGQLKKDAIGSIATFEALVKSYQVAIGPGLAAGLDLDQVRVLSKRLAEGAITLGVPLNQLSEEIRSLLQGTATARNTRIAVLFGGAKEANEAIRNAKEQGNLYEVLTEKLEGIAMASGAASQTFEVLQSDMQDAVQILLAQGGIEYFDQLKSSLIGLRAAITQEDEAGGFIFTPEALGLVQEVSGTLAEVIASFREVTDTAQVFVFLRNAIATVGDALKAIAPLASGIFQGLITGINVALGPLRMFADLLRGVARILGFQKGNKALAKIVKYLVAGATALLVWYKIVVLLPLYYGKLLHTLGVIGLKFQQILVTQTVALANTLGITVGTASWNLLLAGVALKMILITGGLTLLLAGIALLVTKTKLFEGAIGDTNTHLRKGATAAEKLEYSITSAGDATAEGAKSAKDWADEIRELQRELIKAKGLAGLEGSAAEVAELFRETVKELSKGTVQWRLQEEAAKTQLSMLEKQLKVLEEQERQLKANGEAQTDAFGIRLDSDITGLGGIGPSPVGEIALEENKLAFDKVAILSKQKELEENIKNARENQLKALELQVKAYQTEHSIAQQVLDDQQARAKDELILSGILYDRANDSVRELALTKARAKILGVEVAQQKELGEIARKTAEDNLADAKELGANQATIFQLTFELIKLKQENARLDTISANKIRQMTEDIDRQKDLLSGNFTTALTEGLQDFSANLPSLGEEIADTISGALSDVAGVVGDVFKDAIDPRNDADFATAFGEFFLDLAGQFVEAITAQLINSALLKAGLGAQEDIAVNGNTLALQQNTLATQALTASNTAATAAGPVGAAGPAINIPTSGGSGGASEAAAEGAAKAGGLVGGIASAAPWVLAILLPLIIGLITSAFKKGGKVVQAFATGGDVNTLPRPSHIPSSDTVPAWLTPGEFVVKKSAVQKYGTGLLNALNNGVLSPTSFSATGMALGGMARGVQAFAGGGGVRQSSAGTQQNTTPNTVVLPVLPANDNTVDQFLTGGRKAFSDRTNKVNYVGDPNKSGSW